MKKQNKKSFRLIGNNEECTKILETFKKNNKYYNKIMTALTLLGDFDQNAIAEIYEVNEEDCSIKISCFDLANNLFIVMAVSSKKSEFAILEKMTNSHQYKYDISLLKKAELTTDNIELTRFFEVFNFKFGRLITDNQTFFSIFLGDDVSFQVQTKDDDKKELFKDLLSSFNKLGQKPDLSTFINIFDEAMDLNQISKSTILNISAFKGFNRVGFLQFEDQPPGLKKKIN